MRSVTSLLQLDNDGLDNIIVDGPKIDLLRRRGSVIHLDREGWCRGVTAAACTSWMSSRRLASGAEGEVWSSSPSPWLCARFSFLLEWESSPDVVDEAMLAGDGARAVLFAVLCTSALVVRGGGGSLGLGDWNMYA